MRLFVGLLCVTPFAAQAQTPLEIGRSYQIESQILGETRVYDVSLPAQYEQHAGRRYPVLVVLDGEFEHEAAASVARFYATMAQLPPLIVVGVRNTNRMRDLTPTPVAGFRVPPEAEAAGGADKFLAFLSDELLPHLDKAYRTTPMRVLVGHSLGGLFAVYALAQKPQVFMGYVVMEPAIWWNNERELRAAGETLKQPAAGRARVMLVNSRGWPIDTTRWGGTMPMIRYISIANETHGSMAMAGMMHGLRTLFADFRPAQWRPGMRPIQILDRYDSLAARIGYAAPIPEDAYATAIRMSIDSRFYDDAARGLERMERALGSSNESRRLREKLSTERAAPPDPQFIQLEIPARRPSPRDATAFIGRWVTDSHEVEIKAAGDTIVVRDRIQFGNGEWYEDNDPVVQVTADGTLEWGLPWFRGLAALVVLKGKVDAQGRLVVTRESRGWVPRQGGPDVSRVQVFRRAR